MRRLWLTVVLNQAPMTLSTCHYTSLRLDTPAYRLDCPHDDPSSITYPQVLDPILNFFFMIIVIPPFSLIASMPLHLISSTAKRRKSITMSAIHSLTRVGSRPNTLSRNLGPRSRRRPDCNFLVNPVANIPPSFSILLYVDRKKGLYHNYLAITKTKRVVHSLKHLYKIVLFTFDAIYSERATEMT